MSTPIVGMSQSSTTRRMVIRVNHPAWFTPRIPLFGGGLLRGGVATKSGGGTGAVTVIGSTPAA